MVGLLTFFLFLYAMVGTQLFAQTYHYECYNDVTGQSDNELLRDNALHAGCGGRRNCPSGYSCLHSEEMPLDVGSAGFDNIGLGMLTMFQVRSRGRHVSRWSAPSQYDK